MKIMNKLLITILLTGIYFLSSGRCEAQVDSSRLLRDNFYNNRASYIGQPLSKLINAINAPVGFSTPEHASTRKTGTASYQNFILYMPLHQGFGVWGLQITLANKVPVDIATWRSQMGSAWDKSMITTLGSQIVTQISK
jgi:hypothetical protein